MIYTTGSTVLPREEDLLSSFKSPASIVSAIGRLRDCILVSDQLLLRPLFPIPEVVVYESFDYIKRFQGRFLLIQNYYCTVYFLRREKVDLGMGYWNPERKLGVAGHFTLKSSKMQSNAWDFFFQIEALLSLKNARLPPILFLDAKSTF